MYARGILFGKMKYELGDHSFVRCPENNLVADIEFKTKGYFSGTYNAIGGTIKNEKTGETYYEISGLWNGEMYLKNVAVWLLVLSVDRAGVSNMRSRLARRRFFSTQQTQNTHRPWLGPSKNRVSGSRRDCGTVPFRRSWRGTTNWQRMRRPRSRTVNERRRPNELMRVWSGAQGYSAL